MQNEHFGVSQSAKAKLSHLELLKILSESGDRVSTPKSGDPGRLPRNNPQGRIGSGKYETVGVLDNL